MGGGLSLGAGAALLCLAAAVLAGCSPRMPDDRRLALQAGGQPPAGASEPRLVGGPDDPAPLETNGFELVGGPSTQTAAAAEPAGQPALNGFELAQAEAPAVQEPPAWSEPAARVAATAEPARPVRAARPAGQAAAATPVLAARTAAKPRPLIAMALFSGMSDPAPARRGGESMAGLISRLAMGLLCLLAGLGLRRRLRRLPPRRPAGPAPRDPLEDAHLPWPERVARRAW